MTCDMCTGIGLSGKSHRSATENVVVEIVTAWLGTSYKQKCSFILGIFKTGCDPPPQEFWKYWDHFFVGYFSPKTFGPLFCHMSPKRWGEKCPKTFGFGQPLPPFSTQKSPLMENTQIKAAFSFVRRLLGKLFVSNKKNKTKKQHKYGQCLNFMTQPLYLGQWWSIYMRKLLHFTKCSKTA